MQMLKMISGLVARLARIRLLLFVVGAGVLCYGISGHMGVNMFIIGIFVTIGTALMYLAWEIDLQAEPPDLSVMWGMPKRTGKRDKNPLDSLACIA